MICPAAVSKVFTPLSSPLAALSMFWAEIASVPPLRSVPWLAKLPETSSTMSPADWNWLLAP